MKSASNWLLRRLKEWWLLLLPLVLLLPGLGGFPYTSPGAPYSDIAVSHYPNAIFLRQALVEYRAIPLWSPMVLSGYPFAANPLSGLWYPFGWPALLVSLPLGFNLLVMAHLLWGGIGMAKLLKTQGVGREAALLGGLAFEAMPKLFAHYGAGHLTLLYAVPWTPWLLLAAPQAGRRWFQPGVLLAIIFLADVRWAAYAGILWLGWLVAHSQEDLLSRVKRFAAQIMLAALLSAPLALPLAEYASLSTRANMTASDILAFSLPPARLLGLLFPDFGGAHEWITYSGAAVLELVVLCVLWRETRSKAKFWLWVAIVSIIFSLGEYLPGMELVVGLPGFSLLRVPPRALFLTEMALGAVAAYGFERLVAGVGEKDGRARLALAGLSLFGILLTGGAWALTKSFPIEFAWGAGVMTAVWLGVELWLRGRMSGRAWNWSVTALVLIDLLVMAHSLFAPRAPEIVLAEGREVAEYLAAQPGRFRAYSPSYSVPQQTAALHGLELTDGVDPLQLESYAAYMEDATGVPRVGYSITLPPFMEGEPATANMSYAPSVGELALLNVGYVTAEFDLNAEGLTLVEQFGRTRVYEVEGARERAYMLEAGASAEVVNWSPNWIEVRADGPGALVLAEVNYPGWQVWVDGEGAEIRSVDGLFRGVELAEGEHEVIFAFRPVSVYAGMGLAGVAIAGLLLWPKRQS